MLKLKEEEMFEEAAGISTADHKKLFVAIPPRRLQLFRPGEYDPELDKIIVTAKDTSPDSLPRMTRTVLKHEINHVSLVKASIPGLLTKIFDLESKKHWMLLLLGIVKQSDVARTLQKIEASERERDYILKDIECPLEGVAEMLTLQSYNKEFELELGKSIFDRYEVYLEKQEMDVYVNGFRLANRIRKRLKNLSMVEAATLLALDNQNYPIRSSAEIFQKIADLNVDFDGSPDDTSSALGVLREIMEKVGLSIDPFSNVTEALVNIREEATKLEMENHVGFASDYVIENLRLWEAKLLFKDMTGEEEKYLFNVKDSAINFMPAKQRIWGVPGEIWIEVGGVIELWWRNPILQHEVLRDFYNLDCLLTHIREQYLSSRGEPPYDLATLSSLFIQPLRRRFPELF